MFLCDEKRIINTASVERFGFLDNNDFSFSILGTTNYNTSEAKFVNGAVIAEFKIHQAFDVLYRGSGEACFNFYVNLIKALKRGDRVVNIKDLHPAEPD